MNERDQCAYRARYVARLAEFGHDPRTLGWSKGNQDERFSALTSLIPLNRLTSVLDVGCGFADLLTFLRARGFRGHYTGIDLVPELIEVAKVRHPSAHLVATTLDGFSCDTTFDLVVASGIFNARLCAEEQEIYLRRTLGQMFDLCRVAACSDFLSSYVDFRREDLSYSSPEGALSIAKSLTRRVALLHHYMPFEFALCMFRDDRVTERSLFHPLFGVCEHQP